LISWSLPGSVGLRTHGGDLAGVERYLTRSLAAVHLCGAAVSNMASYKP